MSAHLTGVRGHRVFPGRLDEHRLSFPERATVTAIRAPLGDCRDRHAVRVWATEIAGTVLTTAVGPPSPADTGPDVPSPGRPGTTVAGTGTWAPAAIAPLPPRVCRTSGRLPLPPRHVPKETGCTPWTRTA